MKKKKRFIIIGLLILLIGITFGLGFWLGDKKYETVYRVHRVHEFSLEK